MSDSIDNVNLDVVDNSMMIEMVDVVHSNCIDDGSNDVDWWTTMNRNVVDLGYDGSEDYSTDYWIDSIVVIVVYGGVGVNVLGVVTVSVGGGSER